jgi:hypothetical protein
MGEYDVIIRNKSNGTETTVTVKTANSVKAAENVSVAATAVSAAENDPRNKGTPTLTPNNVYGTSAKKPVVTRKAQKALNAMSKQVVTPSEPVSTTKRKSVWEQTANRVAAKQAAEAAATSVMPPTGGMRRIKKRKTLRKARQSRKQRK